MPPKELPTPCGGCNFIKSEGTLPGLSTITAPVFYCLPIPESSWLDTSKATWTARITEAVQKNTEAPAIPRMCEWMASTATPARGPDLRA